MTCIVGIVDGNVVLMGSDSAATDDNGNLEVQREPKIFTLLVPVTGRPGCGASSGMLVGFAGSFLVAQAIRWGLKVPAYHRGEPLMKYLVTRFVPAAKAAVIKALGEPKEEPVFRDASFLIGFQGHLFTLESNGQLLETIHGYGSVGSGASVALGAMWASIAAGGRSGATEARQAPWATLEDGLHAAEYFCSGVRRPFHIEYVMT